MVGRRRAALACGSLLGVVALTTAAYFTDFADITTHIDGSGNSFDIVVAGSIDPKWAPAPTEWAQATEEPFLVDLGTDGSLAPGTSRTVRVAVKNASPKLGADIQLVLRDPDPQGTATDPVTGGFVELFDQLEFEVFENDELLLHSDGAQDEAGRTVVWSRALPSTDVRVLDVKVTLPRDVDDRWQRAGTQLQFGFEAVGK
ncbi:hypothetical protein [Leucobacter luti]|uniref:Ribosomally synthesized peptide with SipW-like signal peptide n=1 Tax=Leucobacter luti TaxID=340320 RepID=A0A4Q7U195_9MICO|nr:hypothetical protein [Leucobacter luti]MBL3698755.1 hypothetical protein [Leucobacter luti]RZT66132.1 hypothetical protein EV139_1558 [Leucobacter luti]